MKNLIFGMGLAMLMVTALVFNLDFGKYIVVQEQLKNTTELSLAGAVHYINEQEYARGYYVFKDTEIIQYVTLVTQMNDFTLYLWDDQQCMRCYKYIKGEFPRLSESKGFHYGTVFTDPYGVKTTIRQPTMAVIMTSTLPFFRQGFKSSAVRSSMYVVEGR